MAGRPASLSKAWQDYIRQQLDRQQRATLRAVAHVVIDEKKARQAAERRIAALESAIAELRERLDQDRGAPRLRAVPPAMIA